ncbi:COMM domain-containing protein 10 isoform X2 [Ceratitis capitata]|uniref:COMM domain-containing protein 10 isoform X2 n=1 Tax=Ceratitis capitata TaxID=7213 RepID=UPI0006188F06|nr:COMM domain-containing protein 10 isoform X2 [Ceratitis capitata]
MAANWIKITESLPFDTFTTVLNFVHRQMIPVATEDVLEPENALEELERLVGVPRADFLLMIKTFSYILRRTSTFVIKPTRLHAELREKLQFADDAKIDAIVRLWVRQTTPIMNSLACERYESNEIHDVAWKLNVEISSHCEQREKNALAMLQLKTGTGEDINLEMNHDELLQLYNQFECIQTELDTLKIQQCQ